MPFKRCNLGQSLNWRLPNIAGCCDLGGVKVVSGFGVVPGIRPATIIAVYLLPAIRDERLTASWALAKADRFALRDEQVELQVDRAE
jgi:hypothetical protein